MTAIREIARAKINLTLTVLGRRPDGYHEIESLVTFADLGDRVSLLPGSAAHVTVGGPFAAGIEGANLLERALLLLREFEPSLRLGAVQLEKNLPVAAGLGGGSADAAALLRAVRQANPEHAGRVPWDVVAARLGADVPVCLAGTPALISGIGEKVKPLAGGLPPMAAALINPRMPLSTVAVYGALDAPAAPVRRPASALPGPLADLAALLDYVRARGNDLELPATSLLPVIAELKAAFAALPGCRLAAMSGSGPTCFGIFAHEREAAHAAGILAEAYPGYWIRWVRLHSEAAT
jgi:4-diphosphocytidyl-2-C-methyl-D-erythritol kinase